MIFVVVDARSRNALPLKPAVGHGVEWGGKGVHYEHKYFKTRFAIGPAWVIFVGGQPGIECSHGIFFLRGRALPVLLMSKKKPFRPQTTTRSRDPKFRTVDGNVQILCPYCDPPHPIYPHQMSACGTILQVSAVQNVFPARTTKKAEVLCVRCGKGGGDMVQFGKGFVHAESSCNPERRMIAAPPHYSNWARGVYNMPKFIRSFVMRFTGPVIEVNEVDEKGQETGKILGYYFGVHSGRLIQRKHTETGAG